MLSNIFGSDCRRTECSFDVGISEVLNWEVAYDNLIMILLNHKINFFELR